MFKFLHAADLHLDSPLKGLERYEGAPVELLRTATRRALENLVQLALDEEVRFVVLAGDIYDGDWPDFQTGLFFIKQMGRLREAGIPVFLVAGNHDAANRMTKTLKLPEHVDLLPHDAPATRELDDCGVAVHGQSFASQAVERNLAREYPKARGGAFNLGLLHTCAVGYDGHERYAPCSLDDLLSKQYDYWALGHVHQRRAVSESHPEVAFSGNVQGRHIHESGPKGCLLVTVDDRLRPTIRFHPLDVLRWEICRCDATGLATADEVLDRLGEQLRDMVRRSEGRPLAARVEVTGACRAHEQLAGQPERWQNEIRARVSDLGEGQVWVEKVKLATRLPADYQLPEEGPIAELIQLLGELRSGQADLTSLAAELAELDRRIPPELKEGPDALELTNQERLREMLDQVQPLLLDRLYAHGAYS